MQSEKEKSLIKPGKIKGQALVPAQEGKKGG